ncbi:MAG: DUF58 domain-containing protein [Myxococcota bacterium]|jgi:uncharacterized protein (DUF58 family)|nr:DUF58 domain-containing protein [Myxococcota bacterium]MEC9440048.1 DUF58 domain-containing protein [Myxococcota bacterium]
MLPKELIKAVKHLEIVARRAVNDQLAGQYQSVFKGRGMDFVDVRAYQPGDDIRVIDWNVSARLDDLYIKQFVEERELTVFLLVDASGSQLFGTQSRRKQECAAELGALIAFSAIKNNDRVGLITFTDKIETFIPPKKGRKHVLRVITEILEQRTTARGTDISAALEHLSRITRKKAVVFLISDFQDEGFEKALNISSRRHEIVPIFLIDPMEEKLPNMGIIQVENPETGELLTVDTTSKKIRDAYEYAATAQREAREKAFRKRKIDHVVVRTDEDYLAPLLKYFRLRARRA